MNAQSRVLSRMEAPSAGFDFEAFFHANYARIARSVARIVGDPARAEDLAIEAFWKLWRTPKAQGELAAGWVYRTALRLALNDIRDNRRRTHYENLSEPPPSGMTPEEAHANAEERSRVRAVLAALESPQAELLLLRHSGFSYEQVASALGMNPASVGTFLTRAQQAFRKEFLKQYGQPETGR